MRGNGTKRPRTRLRSKPLLALGQISSLEVALAAKEYAHTHKVLAEEFLKELILRKELAFNFRKICRPVGFPEHSYRLGAQHSQSSRQRPTGTCVYGRQYVQAETADVLWNAAQNQMPLRGTSIGTIVICIGGKDH